MNQDNLQKFLSMELTPAQKAFVESTERFTMFAGGRGMGIGFALRRDLTEIAINEAGVRIAVISKNVRRIYEAVGDPLIQSGIAREKKDWPRGVSFRNGSEICFMPGMNLKDFHRYAGMEFEVIAIYDAHDITESEHEFIKTMNRTARKGGTLRMLYTAHPGGVGHQWIKRLFIDRKYKEHEKASDYRFIKASMQDNPYLMNDEEYQRALGNLPEETRKTLLDDGWEPEQEKTNE